MNERKNNAMWLKGGKVVFLSGFEYISGNKS